MDAFRELWSPWPKALAAHDQPHARAPPVGRGELGNVRVFTLASVLVDRDSPSLLVEQTDLLPHVGGEVRSDHEVEAVRVTIIHDGVTVATRIHAYHNLMPHAIERALGQLREPERERVEQILGAVRAGIAGALQDRKRLARGIQRHHDRMEPESALVIACRKFLRGMRRNERRVDIDHQPAAQARRHTRIGPDPFACRAEHPPKLVPTPPSSSPSARHTVVSDATGPNAADPAPPEHPRDRVRQPELVAQTLHEQPTRMRRHAPESGTTSTLDARL